jgi:multidrug resistance efflux pump
MKTLYKKTRIDNLRNEQRPAQRNTGKWIYISLLLAFFIWLINYSIGDYVLFKSEGMIINEETTIALDYTASIKQINAEKGDKIKAGKEIVQVNSVQVLQQITELSIKISELTAKKMEIENKISIIRKISPLAAKRAVDMSKLRKTQEFAISKGLTSTRDMSDLLEKEYDSQMNQEKLVTEYEASSKELEEISAMISQLKNTLDVIEKNYSNGIIKAKNDGIVSEISVNAGGVVNSGDPIMTILTGKPYVLAYVKPGALYSVKIGDPIRVQYGIAEVNGTISQILPLSARLPDEFQHTFRPKERSQIIRIEFNAEPKEIPATYTKVNVTRNFF